VNINISARLHKGGEKWEHKVRIHSAAGCCSIMLCSVAFVYETCCTLEGSRMDGIGKNHGRLEVRVCYKVGRIWAGLNWLIFMSLGGACVVELLVS
jgi:hypothetical protein